MNNLALFVVCKTKIVLHEKIYYYKFSCRPAIVYKAVIDTRSMQESYKMKPVGHSHYSGKTGELFTDLSTLTTALQIADSVVVRIK